jgi:hypothetical protein
MAKCLLFALASGVSGFAFMGPDFGEKGEKDMGRKIRYTNEPMKMGERVKDFLPPPGKLVKREKTVKVTLELTEDSVAFFKRQAKRQSVPYQRMMRGLIDFYAHRFETAS